MLVPLETSGPRSPACPPGPLAITRASKPGSQGPRELDRQQQVNYHTLLGAVGHGSGRKAWIALSLSMVCSVRTLFGTRGRAANMGCDSIMSPAGDCLNHAVSGSGRRPIYLHFPGQSDSIRSLSLQGVLECLGSLRILSKRRGWDSNPRKVSLQTISSRSLSTTQPPLQAIRPARHASKELITLASYAAITPRPGPGNHWHRWRASRREAAGRKRGALR